MCATYMPSADRGQEKVSDALKLELQAAGQPVGDSSNLGAGN